jgi:hypothetical protein
LPAQLDEAALKALLYRKDAPPDRSAQPDYAVIHQELKRKGGTLQLLWEEYEKAYGQSAYRYSQFCLHYHEYRGRLARTMRQVYVGRLGPCVRQAAESTAAHPARRDGTQCGSDAQVDTLRSVGPITT